MSDTMSRTLSVHQEHEMLLALEKAGIVPDEAQAIISSKKNQLAQGMVGWLREQLAPATASGRFARYSHGLLSLESQLEYWKFLDANVWNGQISKAGWFDGVNTNSDHIQSVDDLQILYVDFGSPGKNIEMYWEAIKANQPNFWRWDGLKTDKKHLRLSPLAKKYEPGIHRVHINLVAHWEPEQGRSVLQVREQAAQVGETLAAAETLAAYTLHDELLRRQDGENFPYTDLAGYEFNYCGCRSWGYVPRLSWSRISRRVYLYANWAGDVDRGWAAPVLRELPACR